MGLGEGDMEVGRRVLMLRSEFPSEKFLMLKSELPFKLEWLDNEANLFFRIVASGFMKCLMLRSEFPSEPFLMLKSELSFDVEWLDNEANFFS